MPRKPKPPQTGSAPILQPLLFIIKFVCQHQRIDLIKFVHAMSPQPTAALLFGGNSSVPVLVSDHLMQEKSKLQKEALKLKKTENNPARIYNTMSTSLHT